jgi:cbb3-type cytochrome oxidase maturation protein
MDISVYLVVATVVTFMVGAAVAFVLAVLGGQFSDLSAAARVVLDGDDPMPVHREGGR